MTMLQLLPWPARGAVAILSLVLLATGCSSGGEDVGSSSSGSGGNARPGATGSPAPSPSPAPPTSTARASGVPAALERQASTTTADYVTAVTSVLARPAAASSRTAPGPVAGAALAQLRNQSQEMSDLGQHVEGRPQVLSAVVTSLEEDPPTMTVSVCLDNSRVRLVDRKGRRLPPAASAKRPTRNILTLTRGSGDWVVTGQTFADDPDC